jgi:hypothetical protein
VPDRAVAGALKFSTGKLVVWGLQFLQPHDIRLRLGEPAQQHIEAAVDAVDVVGGKFHLISALAIALVALTRLGVVFCVMTGVG